MTERRILLGLAAGALLLWYAKRRFALAFYGPNPSESSQVAEAIEDFSDAYATAHGY